MAENRSNRKRKKKRNRIILYVFMGLFLVLYTMFWKTYHEVNDTAGIVFNDISTTDKRGTDVAIEATQPISFAFLGVDNGIYGEELDKAFGGRSDAILIGTVNPNTRTTTLVSIPRDTYAWMVDYETYDGEPFYDKLTHAYAFGDAEMAINSIQELIDIPIDYYVEMNMQGLIDMVDAIGGITVTSPLTFEYEENYFTEGETRKLNGKEALAFSRMRKTDLEGDFGRQKREKLVIKAVLDKVLSFGTISNFSSMLDTLEDNMKTNLTLGDIVNMYGAYGKSLETFETANLVGEELWLDDVYYLYAHPADRLELSNLLRDQLELDHTTLDDMTLSDEDLYNLDWAY